MKHLVRKKISYKSIEVEVEVDLDDFSNQELLDELEDRGIFVPTAPTQKILTITDLNEWKKWVGVGSKRTSDDNFD